VNLQILDCDLLLSFQSYQVIAIPFISTSNVQYTWMDACRQVRSVAGLSLFSGSSFYLTRELPFDVCLFLIFESNGYLTTSRSWLANETVLTKWYFITLLSVSKLRDWRKHAMQEQLK
jgi:hypothetical protein